MHSRSRPGRSEHRALRGRRLYWLSAGAGAAAFLLVLASQLFVWINLWPIRASWTQAMLWAVPQLLIWSGLALGVLELSRRLPLTGGRALPRVAFHLAASAVGAFLALAILDVSDRLLGWSALMGAPAKLISDFEMTVVHLHLGIGAYWVVLGLHHASRYHRESREGAVRASRLEAELVQAQLHALQMQLNPHFLFNTLNSIAVLMRRDVEGAERMLHRLGELLQTTLDHGGRQHATLAEELDYLERYLEIEKVRFGDRLDVVYDVDPTTRELRVPFLILHPLVENAVRHAVAPRDRPVRIRIRAARVAQGLELAVRDDGPGVPDSWSPDRDAGVGLTNTRERLTTLYGDDFELELGDSPAGGFVARIVLPAEGPEQPDDVASGEMEARRRARSAPVEAGEDRTSSPPRGETDRAEAAPDARGGGP
ncbi:MAG: sensor histidine kinase [Gemmatimonadota bacterium]